jgi:hypothetical protein
MALVIVVVAVVGPLVGFLTGFTLFRRSTGWCPECGRSLQCVVCLRMAQRLLDSHITSSATGRCLACGTPSARLAPGDRRSDPPPNAGATVPTTQSDTARPGAQ